MSDSNNIEDHAQEPENREPERVPVWTLSPDLKASIMADDEDDDGAPSMLSSFPDNSDSGEDFLLNVQQTTTRPTTRQRQDETDRCVLGQDSSILNNNPRSLLPEAAIVGLKFRDYGPVFYCTAGNLTLGLGDFVMADCEQGLGKIVRILEDPPENLSVLLLEPAPGPQGLPDTISLQQQQDLPPIIRLANPQDMDTAVENSDLAVKARTFCQDSIRNLHLDMKLVDVEIYHDRSKIIFYFTAPTRIDFRELVKELVKSYRTRIELRQIGVRHETQMLGGIGNCGMVCCCRRYLRRFAPVTIKMAKEQNLFLNPAKISGLCGRLLCCLSYEQENYENFHRLCPKIGKRYQTDQGIFKVLRVNMFRTSIIALADGAEEQEFSIDDWKALHPVRNDSPPPANAPGNFSNNPSSGPTSGPPSGSAHSSGRHENQNNSHGRANSNGFSGKPGNSSGGAGDKGQSRNRTNDDSPVKMAVPNASPTISPTPLKNDGTVDLADSQVMDTTPNAFETPVSQEAPEINANPAGTLPQEELSPENELFEDSPNSLSEEQSDEDNSIFGLSPQKSRFHKKPHKGNRN